MKKKISLFFVSIFVCACMLQAQTFVQKFYIDFGQDNSNEGRRITTVDNNGNYRNNVIAPAGSPSTLNPTSVNLKNAVNTSTDYVLEVARPIKSNGGSNGGLSTPDPALLGDLAVGTATEDYFFLDTNMGKGLFLFKNLDINKAYKFYIYGCRTASGNQRGVIYSLSGKNGSHGKQLNTGTSIGADGYNGNNNNVWESAPIIPKDNGEIIFESGRLFSGEMAYISALKIEEWSGYEIPVAQTRFYIDFGKNNNGLDGKPTIGPDVNNNYWNNMYSNGDDATSSVSDGTGTLTLKNSANETTAYVLELGSTVQWNGARNGALTNPDVALTGDLAIASATSDYLFIDGDAKVVLNFKNLNKNKQYRFNIFGSRTDSGNEGRIGRIELTGNNTVTGIHQMGGSGVGANGYTGNNKNIFVSDPITPDAGGKIVLTMTRWLGMAHINCIKLEEIAGEELPVVTAIGITGSNITQCGRTSQMGIAVTPKGALSPAVTWSIDKEEMAYISESGKLYAKANGTVNVTATAVLEDETVLSDTKEIIISGQSVGDHSFTVMGSSVPWGQGAEPRDQKGYAWLWTNSLSENAVNTWTTNNISIGGNNTQNIIDRWDSDLLPSCSRYVYYGLSLGNEGIHERGETAFVSWHDNMQKIIARTREMGKMPIIGTNYPRGDFNETDYNFVKQLNLLIHEWDVPSVNLLGAIDNGAGKWASGYVADNAHPNTAGHAEMFYAVVPSLLDAIAAEKPQPMRNGNTSLTLNKTNKAKRIVFTPEGTLHSFTLSFDFKTTDAGTIASFVTSNGNTIPLTLGNDGKLTYKRQSSAEGLNDGSWHTVSLTHYYAWGRTFLYIDGELIPRSSGLSEKLVPVQFFLNDFENTLQSVEYRDLFFFRAGMCAEEISALNNGKMLKSSLEIYAPLNGNALTEAEILNNLAQSFNTLQIEEKVTGTGLDEILIDKKSEIKEITVYSFAGQKLFCITENQTDYCKNLSKGVYVAKIITRNDDIFVQKIMLK